MTVAEAVQRQVAADDLTRAHDLSSQWNAYFGRYDDALDVPAGGADDNVKLPLARIFVDASRSFLFGKEPEFTISDNANAEEYLDEVWDANEKQSLLNLIALNGGVTGHAFARLYEPGIGQMPRIIPLDPQTVDVVWSEDDYTDVTAYVITWTVERRPDPVSDPVMVAKRQLIERAENRLTWLITDQESKGDRKGWKTTGTAVWAHAYAPIVDCQNLPVPNCYYGVSDLESDVLGLIKTLNYQASNMNRILRLHAHPKVYVRGAVPPIAQPGDAPYGFAEFGQNGQRQGQPRMDWGPDEAIFLQGDGEVGQLVPAADMSASLQFFDRMLQILHETARIPEVALGITEGVGPVPGVTLKILYGPLLSMTEDKRRLYGEMLVELSRRILDLGGYGDNLKPEISWPDPMPRDPMTEAQAAVMLEQAGVSKATALTDLGYDSDVEQTQRQADAQEAGSALMNAMAQNAQGG